MKNLLFVSVVVLLASCSSSQQVAKFQSSKVDVGYHPVKAASAQPSVAVIEPSTLTASTRAQSVVVPAEEIRMQVKETYSKLSKQEKREVRQLLKKEIKAIVKSNKTPKPDAVTAKSSIDHDLKLAAIFGAVGLVALIIGTDVFFIIGAIALIIGTVFFVKWLLQQ